MLSREDTQGEGKFIKHYSWGKPMVEPMRNYKRKCTGSHKISISFHHGEKFSFQRMNPTQCSIYEEHDTGTLWLRILGTSSGSTSGTSHFTIRISYSQLNFDSSGSLAHKSFICMVPLTRSHDSFAPQYYLKSVGFWFVLVLSFLII